MRPWSVILGLMLCSVGFTGCAGLLPERAVPMDVEGRQRLGPGLARGLVVLLPGAGDRAATFVEQGVLDAVAERAPGFDVIAADAHAGYMVTEELVPRLVSDVVGPAYVAGYRQIWLLGVSLGGLGATIYASHFPQHVDGVILVAPYLGDMTPIGESVLRADDLASWSPPEVGPDDTHGRALVDAWLWLQRQTGPAADRDVLLAYGDRDGPGTLDQRLWDALPADRRVLAAGGHEWTVWRPLIAELLTRMSALAELRALEPPGVGVTRGSGPPAGRGG